MSDNDGKQRSIHCFSAGVAIVAGIGAAFFLNAYFANRFPKGLSLTYGTVESARQESYHGFLPAEVLTVRLDNTDIRVKAELWKDQPEDIPRRVSFYYDGNPSSEVYLLEESSFLFEAVIFLLVAIGAIAVFIDSLKKKRHAAP